MFRDLSDLKLRQILLWILIGTALFLSYQNCSEGFNAVDSVTLSSELGVMAISVTEHPMEVKEVKTSFELQLADRNYVAGILTDLFGPSSVSAITTNISLKPAELGGPCSEYSHYKVKVNAVYQNKDPALVCNQDNTTKRMVAPPQAVRQGWIIQTCAALVGKDSTPTPATLSYALDKIQPGATLSKPPAVTNENLTRLHQLFYRARPLPPQSVFDAAKLMFSESSPTIEQWKTAIYGYCISSHWQVL